MDGIDNSLIDWSRAQFALTAMYHWIFVPLTLGLGIIIAMMETRYYRTGLEKWKKTAKFWMKLFGINFAVGVATGLILEFQFGTNWSNYSWFVGDIFGAPLAIEGIMAFFLETTFLAVMFFGWNKVSKGFHLASTWLTVIGASISALWILVANAWMQFPTGMEFNPDTVRNEMVDFWAVLLSPVAMSKFFHTVSSGWIVGGAFTIGISCYYLLKGRSVEFAKDSIRYGAIVGAIGILVAIYTGDSSAYQVAQKQPMKLAAMEGLYHGSNGQGLIMVGMLKSKEDRAANPHDPYLFKVEAPKLLSFLSFRNADAFVPGINDLLQGGFPLNTPQQDSLYNLSAAEKMRRGTLAVNALGAYKQAKKEKNETLAAEHLAVLRANYPYFGYGFIKNEAELVPPVALNFYSFRFMVMVGCYLLVFFLYFLIQNKRGKSHPGWINRLAVVTIPLAYLCTFAGWIVAEVGRQPWVIQDIMPTYAAISKLEVGSVQTTFVLFCVLFTVLLIAELSILFKQIQKGPEAIGDK